MASHREDLCQFLHEFQGENAGCDAMISQLGRRIQEPIDPQYGDIIETAWSAIHSGPWQETPIAWRAVYSVASWFQAQQLLAKNEHQRALRQLDLALLVGVPLPGDYLHESVTHIKQVLDENSAAATSSGTGPSAALSHATLNLMERVAAAGRDIPRITAPSLDEFLTKYLMSSTPVIITRAMAHWPALGTRMWRDFGYLSRRLGPRTVPVEVGLRYTDAEWAPQLMTFDEFLARFMVDAGEDAGGSTAAPVGYLAQHTLFDQAPELRADVAVPDYCMLARNGADDDANNDGPALNAWFGPRGTVSPCHTDPQDNLLAQVVGAKYIRLYHPDQTPYLYPRTETLANTSQADMENPDLAQFPNVAQAIYRECVLCPGEMLFIPVGHWHYIRSLEPSFSVSFWWGGGGA